METKVFESPQELVQFLSNKEEMLKTPSGLGAWYWRAKLFYDPNICGCKKKNLTEESIANGYRYLGGLPEAEKSVARNIVGSGFTLKINGEIVGTF